MSQTISFTDIPSTWNVPGSYGEIKPIRVGQGLTAFPSRILLIGQALKGFGAVWPITTGAGADAMFGTGSPLAEMVRAAIAANSVSRIDAIGVAAPNGSVAAQWAVTFGSAPTRSGLPAITIGGFRTPFSMAVTDTAAIWASNFAAAVNANPRLAVTAVAAAAVVTLTAKAAGVVMNDLLIQWGPAAQDILPGVTVTIGQSVQGSGTPLVTDALNLVPNTWYTDIISGLNDPISIAAMDAEGVRRFGPMVKLDTRFYIGYRGTYGQLAALSPNQNSRFIFPMAANASQTPPWIWAAVYGAVAAAALNNDPARQLRTLSLPGVVAPADVNQFQETQRNLLLSEGWGTFKSLSDGTVTIERAISMYQQTSEGIADTAWRDIMTMSTMSRIRYDWNAYVQETYPNSKLCDPGTIAARLADNTVTVDALKASWTSRCTLYESLGWIENSTVTSKQASFVRNATDRNRVDDTLPVMVIGNLMDVMSSHQFEV